MKYFSMFTGVGGFEIGIRKANRKIRFNEPQNGKPQNCRFIKSRRRYSEPTCVGFSEIDKYASELLKKRFKGVKNYGDATKIKTEELPDFDMLCGGFPCQAFSIAGKRKGFKDTRGTLFFEIARIVKAKRPKIVLLENVKGLLNHEKGKTFATIIQTLSELGYDVQWMVLNSKFFGVPQNRERVFIIGSIRGEPRPEILPFRATTTEDFKPSEIHNAITQAIGRQGSSDEYIDSLKKINVSIQSHYPRSSTSGKGGTGPLISKEHCFTLDRTPHYAIMDLYNKKEHTDRCPTLTEPHHNSIRVREQSKIRRLTPTECERLQGFPDGWTEGFSDTQRYKMMGNAVTVNVIEAIMSKICGVNEQYDKDFIEFLVRKNGQ